MGLTQGGRHVLVIFHQFAQHFALRHIGLVVVLNGLQFRDLADRTQRNAAQPMGWTVVDMKNDWKKIFSFGSG